MKPATAACLQLLREHPEGVTHLDALDAVGSSRLAARVNELRKDGYPVTSEYVTTPFSRKRIKRYWLVEQPEQLRLGVA